MDKPFEGWALLELMGYRQRPGYVREAEIAGSKMLRIDIPVGCDDADQDILVTEYYAPSAVYSLRPCSEDVIRAEIGRYGNDPRPVRPLDFKERARISDGDAGETEDEQELAF